MRCVHFNVLYEGIPLLDILDQKAHPSLQNQPGKPRKPVVEYNNLLSMMRAARAYGWDAFWNASHEAKLLMVGQMLTDSAIDAFTRYDMNPANNK